MLSERVIDLRPWGKWELFAANEKCTVKLLYIEKGKRNSYQYHKHRAERWFVVSGNALVTLDGKEMRVGEGSEIVIPAKAKHRLTGISDVIVLEVIRGQWDENDIVRLQDDFKRGKSNWVSSVRSRK